MTQIKVSRLVEVGKILATKVGQEIPDFVQYVADLAEQVVRALRNGLSFTDNMDATFKTVSLVSGLTAAVNVGARRPVGIWPVQVVSTAHGWESFHWYIDGSGQAQVVMTFTGTPVVFTVTEAVTGLTKTITGITAPSSAPLSVVLLIIYG
jgi:hypothetical protein